MLRRILLMAGWLFPVVLLVLFAVKGRFYDPAAFTPPASAVSALPMPTMVGGWVLEDGIVLPADRMYEKINGKAAYYLQYGADQLCCGEWVENGQHWDMYLYRFETGQGARGAYSGERPSDGQPIEGSEGYTVPGQAAMTAGTYYLQLNALVANADAGPAVELAMSLVPFLGESLDGTETDAQIDLTALAAEALVEDAEGFLPESAFGFSVFNNVRTVQVSLDGAEAVWFTTSGDEALVTAYLEELAMYGGEDLFTEDSASGGSMFGSWGLAGVLNGEVWGVQNAPSRAALMRHWNVLKERLSIKAGTP
jgi:hypothetical protein